MTSPSASIPFISNTSALSYFLNGVQKRVPVDHANYPALLAALSRGASEPEILEIEKEGEIPSMFTEQSDGLYFEGERLPNCLAVKVRSLVKQKLDIQFFLNFWGRLKNNRHHNAIQQLFSFLEVKELPITPDGYFLAYKGLREDFWSITGNTATRVKKGRVDEAGRIYNGVGETIEVDERDVNDDPNVGCSNGLHAGSLSYAQGFAQGKLVVVKIDPADVISVPHDCSHQKLRTSKYEVIAEYGGEIKSAAADNKANPIENADSAEFSARKARVASYLEKKKGENVALVTARQIQSSFSPSCPSVAEIRTILGQLGVTVDREGNAVLFW